MAPTSRRPFPPAYAALAERPADATDSLAFFRVAVGLLLLLSFGRFVARGWVTELYVLPRYFFTYYGFGWVHPLPAGGLYAVFAGLLVAAVLVALGAGYRWVSAALFVGFTYVELLDKTNYLNHYYFLSLLTLLMAVLPLNAAWSLDAWRHPGRAGWFGPPPAVALRLLRLQVGLVYFFAGVAKIKPEWLLEAQPLRLWLAAHGSMPVLGPLLEQRWVAYAGSWFGMLFDLTIPLWLSWRRTRRGAYALVVFFHVVTWKLFYIGMFPWIMMVAALIFFEPATHRRWLELISRYWLLVFGPLGSKWLKPGLHPAEAVEPEVFPAGQKPTATHQKLLYAVLAGFFLIQMLLPFRYLLYPGNVLWTEQGYRFSWNVMLMEKSGFVEFTVRETGSGRQFTVTPGEYLTPQQQRMLSTQPDMVLQFAHFLAETYRRRGVRQPQVYAECYAGLNGHGSRLLIDPGVDLARQPEGFGPKPWILQGP